jgi:hypothetical protein
MGGRQRTLAVLLAAVTLAGAGSASAAISLGEPQAMSSSASLYIFRLPLAFQPPDHGDTAAITVHSPADARLFVKPKMLELHLPRLTDVEIEVTQAGQTLNRLVLKTELQRLHARLEASTAWKRYQAAKARNHPQTRLAALLETALTAHHAWARFDPLAASQPLALVDQERATLLPADGHQAATALVEDSTIPAEPPPATSAPAVVDTAGLEAEMELIRAQMQSLVRDVLPWEPEAPNVHVPGPLAISTAMALILGGLLWTGMASLVTGYCVHRRALDRERQRRRLFAAAIQRARQALPSSSLALAHVASPPLPGIPRTGLPSMAVVGHLSVRRRTRRRLHIRRHGDWRGQQDDLSAEELAQLMPQMMQAMGMAPSELLATVASLRHELSNLRLTLAATTNPDEHQAGSPPPTAPLTRSS